MRSQATDRPRHSDTSTPATLARGSDNFGIVARGALRGLLETQPVPVVEAACQHDQSLDRVRTLRFSRVYLAGSVLPREFARRDIADRGQVTTLVNACGAKDKPVGWLCSGLRGLGMRDVGMGGFTGFNVTPAGTVQFLNLSGGHGAGLTDARLPSVVAYISAGTTPAAATVAPSAGFTTMSRLAPVLAWLLVLVLLGAIAWIAVGFTVVKLAVVLGVLALVYLALKVV